MGVIGPETVVEEYTRRHGAIMAAYYTNGGKSRMPLLTLVVIDGVDRKVEARMAVGARREARKIAVAAGFTPWNF